MIKRLLFGVCSAFILTACQSAPTPLHLTPQLDTTETDQRIALTVRDQRAHNHVLRLEQNDQTAEFATADPSLASLITDTLHTRWQSDDQSDAQLQIVIQEALLVIKQGNLRHDTEHRIRLQAYLTTPRGEFRKTFTGQRESSGPLRADIPRIEREFSALLGSVLSDLANDEQLNHHLEETR